MRTRKVYRGQTEGWRRIRQPLQVAAGYMSDRLLSRVSDSFFSPSVPARSGRRRSGILSENLLCTVIFVIPASNRRVMFDATRKYDVAARAANCQPASSFYSVPSSVRSHACIGSSLSCKLIERAGGRNVIYDGEGVVHREQIFPGQIRRKRDGVPYCNRMKGVTNGYSSAAYFIRITPPFSAHYLFAQELHQFFFRLLHISRTILREITRY